MKAKSDSFISKRKEISSLKKQLISISEENRKLKNALFIVDNFKEITAKVILRNRMVLILKSIGNFFTFSSKRIAMLSKEIESLKKENIALRLKQQQAHDWMFRSFQQNVSFHSQGSVDRAML